MDKKNILLIRNYICITKIDMRPENKNKMINVIETNKRNKNIV